MDMVAIVAIVFGSLILMELIKTIGKVRASKRNEIGASVGLGELEERMQQAVTAAIEPLREQLDGLERRIDRIEPERMLGQGEREGDRR